MDCEFKMNSDKACDILELCKKHTNEMLKKAYHKAALKHHPDKGGDPEKFKQVKDAYEYLLSSDGMKDYTGLDFDIEGIAQVAWSGQGQSIEEAASVNTGTSATNDSNSQSVAAETSDGLINEGISSTSNYVRNKLTDLTMVYDHANTSGTKGLLGSSNTTYSMTLTGGNVTIENNLTYLTPETLGSVNLPLGHVMGTRSVSGNFTCYLNDTSEGSLQLFEDLQESRGVITNAFDLKFAVGGQNSTPRMNLEMAKCHLELPTHSIEDVISVDVNFHALPTDLSSATKASATNELKVTYAAG